MFIIRNTLVVSRFISRCIVSDKNRRFECNIKSNLKESSNHKRTLVHGRNENDKTPVYHNKIIRQNNHLKPSHNYNELLQVSLLLLSAYDYPLYLLSGLSNTTTATWLRPKNLRSSKKPASIANIWLFPVFFWLTIFLSVNPKRSFWIWKSKFLHKNIFRGRGRCRINSESRGVHLGHAQ